VGSAAAPFAPQLSSFAKFDCTWKEGFMKTFLLLLSVTAQVAAAPPLPDFLAAPLPIPRLSVVEQVSCECAQLRLGAPADRADLHTLSGKADTSPSAALDGVVGTNAATNVSTGANLITNGAFSNMSGLPVVIQNSGANVLIQNATVINLQLR
jgi:hypothetical protein